MMDELANEIADPRGLATSDIIMVTWYLITPRVKGRLAVICGVVAKMRKYVVLVCETGNCCINAQVI